MNDLVHIVIPVSTDLDASRLLDIVQDLCPELEETLQSYGSYNDEDVASIDELDVSIDTAPALAAAAPELLAALVSVLTFTERGTRACGPSHPELNDVIKKALEAIATAQR